MKPNKYQHIIDTPCPCGSKQTFGICCYRYISGQEPAPTPEALMRSRYTAYTLNNIKYIMKTVRGPAAKEFNPQSARQWASSVNWLGLQVIKTWTDAENHGFVEFTATYGSQKKLEYLHELSEFSKEDGCWFYVDGEKPKSIENQGA